MCGGGGAGSQRAGCERQAVNKRYERMVAPGAFTRTGHGTPNGQGT